MTDLFESALWKWTGSEIELRFPCLLAGRTLRQLIFAFGDIVKDEVYGITYNTMSLTH